MNTEVITTHEIRRGDVILNHGMRLRVDTEPQVSRAHPVDGPGGECRWTRAVVENFDALKSAAKSGNDTARYLLSFIESDMSSDGLRARNGMLPDTEPRWTIQGNGLARWRRVIR